MIRKDLPPPPSRRAARWWSAPARFTAASLTLLRRAAVQRGQAGVDDGAWVRQTPVGIRAQ